MLKKRAFVYTLVLGFLALVFTLYDFSTGKPEVVSKLDQDDWQIFQSESWHIDRNQPQEQHYLKTEFMRQQNDKVYATNPKFILIKPDEAVQLTSQQAEVTQQTQFEFIGDVQVIRLYQNPEENTELYTEWLHYNQDDERIHTPLAVTLINQQQTTTGIGLEMNINQQHTKILSEVKTYYVP